MKTYIYGILGVCVALSIVIGSIVIIESSKADAGESAGALAAISLEDHAVGDKASNVTLIEYSDFQCPACKAYDPLVLALQEEFGDKLFFVYRHFPLPQHMNAELAAQAAEAAGQQGKFWEMKKMLFEYQDAWATMQDAAMLFENYAALLKLNLVQFKADMNSSASKDRVLRDYESGVAAGVNATPTFFLNGKKIVNPRSYDEFRQHILAALAE